MNKYTVSTDAVLMLDGRKVAEFVTRTAADLTAKLLNAQRAEAAYFARKAA